MKPILIPSLLCAAALVLTLGCNNNDGGSSLTPGTGGRFVPVDVCDDPSAPEGCGDACIRDSNCLMGTHCASAGSCIALCTAAGGCDTESVCTDRGRCERVLPEGGTGGTTTCIDDELTPTGIEPNVVFLIDRSGSMDNLLDGEEHDRPGMPNPSYLMRVANGERTRWEIAHDAIGSVLGDLDGIVQFGLATYSGDAAPGSLPMCPHLVSVDVARNNATAILSRYLRDSDPDGHTPTALGIDAVAARLKDKRPTGDGPTVIVLATDGEPNQCSSGSPNSRREVVDAAEAAFGAGIQTFVLSVGEDIRISHLQEVANVGVGFNRDGSQGEARFWVGEQPEDLEAAFRTIVNDQITCELKLNGVVGNTDRVCDGDIRLDGAPLECGVDWRLVDGTNDTIELLGRACKQWRMGDAKISAVFPCGILQPG